jgi:hypothetical protein
MTAVRVLYALAVLNLVVLLAGALYNLVGTVLPAAR